MYHEEIEDRALLPNRAWLDRNQSEFQYVYGQIPNHVFKNISKYWHKRETLFSRFEEGILMTEELWFSVTPEAMAIFTAKFIKACDPTINTVLDVFCGGGGNVIQFARFFDKCYGVEFNEMHLYCAEKNCEVYGVLDRTNLKLGSWTDLIGSKYYHGLKGKIDFIFSSPPWGGPGYKSHKVYNLEDDLQPMGLRDLLESFFAITPNVGLFLPKNSDWDQLSEVTRDLLGVKAKCRVMFVYDQDRCKGILAFWGEKFQNNEYDYAQELEDMPYYYMSERKRDEMNNPQSEEVHVDLSEQYSMDGRYPGRVRDKPKDQRYATGDYADDFYDEKDPQEEVPSTEEIPAAWFDPVAQRWYGFDATTNQTHYITEDSTAPEGFVIPDMGAWGTEPEVVDEQDVSPRMYDDSQITIPERVLEPVLEMSGEDADSATKSTVGSQDQTPQPVVTNATRKPDKNTEDGTLDDERNDIVKYQRQKMEEGECKDDLSDEEMHDADIDLGSESALQIKAVNDTNDEESDDEDGPPEESSSKQGY